MDAPGGGPPVSGPGMSGPDYNKLFQDMKDKGLSLPGADPGAKPHLSAMQLEMKAQQIPDSPTIEKWRTMWNSKFPPSQAFTSQYFQQFVGGLFKFLQYLIKQEKTEASSANSDLKKSETDSD